MTASTRLHKKYITLDVAENREELVGDRNDHKQKWSTMAVVHHEIGPCEKATTIEMVRLKQRPLGDYLHQR